ncbi:zinc ribbon domain-containing protein [Halomarina halobia]|uniref:Zinc ribbon domain-containing protein n=1 Tax=Halomarina halobia TaxID=3033386 RepID=A0ABD6ABY1_9EURY|nr:zinc ribbon domain-containing protein [Halomarina sp. PSR21]
MSKRRPLFAVALAFVYPGLGHVYLREWLRALLWFLLTVATAVLVVPPNVLDGGGGIDAILRAQRNLPLSAALAIIAVTAFSMLDAYRLAAHDRDRATASAASSSGATASGGDEFRCPDCRRTIDAEYDFCPWCATEFEREPGPEAETRQTR